MSSASPDTATGTPAQRRVWEALSPLYLDSACDDAHDGIAQPLADSPFTLTPLHAMLLHEVRPVSIGNPGSVAGVWDRFDSDWLAAAISTQRARRWRWPHRWCWRACARTQWHWLAPEINALRASATR